MLLIGQEYFYLLKKEKQYVSQDENKRRNILFRAMTGTIRRERKSELSQQQTLFWYQCITGAIERGNKKKIWNYQGCSSS